MRGREKESRDAHVLCSVDERHDGQGGCGRHDQPHVIHWELVVAAVEQKMQGVPPVVGGLRTRVENARTATTNRKEKGRKESIVSAVFHRLGLSIEHLLVSEMRRGREGEASGWRVGKRTYLHVEEEPVHRVLDQ